MIKFNSGRYQAVGIIVAGFLAVSGEMKAREKIEVPRVVLSTFAEKYPNVRAKKWERDSHGLWEAHFNKGGRSYRADFKSSGSWVETELSISKRALPRAIKDAIKAQFPGEKINEVEKVDSATKGQFYDVEFKRPGSNMDVEYRADGRRVR